MSEDKHWYSGVVGTVVIPLVAIAALVFALPSIISAIFGNQDKIRKETADQIAQVWVEYDKEYKEFIQKGYLTTGEENILNAKIGLVKGPMQKLADAIGDPNKIMIELGIALIVAGSIVYLVLHGGNLGANLRKFWNGITGKTSPGSIGTNNGMPQGYNINWTYATAEELATLFKISAIMDIADAGNIGLASQAMSALHAGWSGAIIPQMSISAQILAAQIPLLYGMQLAMATQMFATYQMYLQAFAFSLPPIFMLPPPI